MIQIESCIPPTPASGCLYLLHQYDSTSSYCSRRCNNHCNKARSAASQQQQELASPGGVASSYCSSRRTVVLRPLLLPAPQLSAPRLPLWLLLVRVRSPPLLPLFGGRRSNHEEGGDFFSGDGGASTHSNKQQQQNNNAPAAMIAP